MSISRSARTIRTAISPRLAISIFRNIGVSWSLFGSAKLFSFQYIKHETAYFAKQSHSHFRTLVNLARLPYNFSIRIGASVSMPFCVRQRDKLLNPRLGLGSYKLQKARERVAAWLWLRWTEQHLVRVRPTSRL